MTQNINTQARKTMTQTIAQNCIYRLAREGAYQIEPFGPMLTLEQAQRYQSDMALANVTVLVKRMGAV